jgi:hypothetical protein
LFGPDLVGAAVIGGVAMAANCYETQRGETP